MFDLAALAPIRISRLQRPDMFAVTPVNGHKGRKAGFFSAIHHVHIYLLKLGGRSVSANGL
jgi:hypothetical protein